MINVSANCTKVDPNLKIEVTPPQLPTTHGTTITYRCERKHATRGGEVEATCQNGNIVFKDLPDGKTPCFKTGAESRKT